MFSFQLHVIIIHWLFHSLCPTFSRWMLGILDLAYSRLTNEELDTFWGTVLPVITIILYFVYFLTSRMVICLQAQVWEFIRLMRHTFPSHYKFFPSDLDLQILIRLWCFLIKYVNIPSLDFSILHTCIQTLRDHWLYWYDKRAPYKQWLTCRLALKKDIYMPLWTPNSFQKFVKLREVESWS